MTFLRAMSLVSVVIPVFRNEKSVQPLYERLTAVLEQCADDHEIVFVEDCGGDNSWNLIQEIASRDSRVKGLKLSRNCGQHPALAAGFEHAQGDEVVMMDGDLQDRPEEIPQLLARLTDDVDVVYTIQSKPRGSWLTQMTSRLYHYTFSRLTRTKVPPHIGTMRAFNRSFLEAILRFGERNVLYGPLMTYIGFNAAYVRVTRDERDGKSSYTFLRRLSLACDSLISYTDWPHRLLIGCGSLLFAGSAMYLVTSAIAYFAIGRLLAPGITLLILLLCLFMGATMLGLGIIGTYIFRVYQEVLCRPRYLVSRSVNMASDSEPDCDTLNHGGSEIEDCEEHATVYFDAPPVEWVPDARD